MKFLSLPALLAAALLSVAAALPFLPAAKTRSDLFQLEVRLSAAGRGTLQAYYDNGTGFREELSARASIEPGTAPVAHRLPLPPGTYRMLRLDPPDHGVVTFLHSLRVVTKSGTLIAELPLSGLQPVQQVESFTFRNGGLEIKSAPNSDDPQLHLVMTPPLVVRTTAGGNVLSALPVVLPVFAALATLLWLGDRTPRVRARLMERWRTLALRPGRLVALVAAVAVIASSYPVVFLGKSLVSPNFGTALLYDQYPTLPGYKDATIGDANGADVGAIMWSHIPLSVVQARALGRDLELPLWNRYNSGGTPLLGQGQSMFGDPLHFLVLAAQGAAWSWDLKYLIAKWLFATGLGLIVLALVGTSGTKGSRDLETKGPGRDGVSSSSPTTQAGESFGPLAPWSRVSSPLLPALLVTLAAPFFGFFLYRLSHPAFFSVCYAPWPLYCWLRLAAANGPRARAAWAGGLLLANFALMNSGTAKEAYMLLVTMNFSGACVVLTAAAPWRDRLIRLATAAWAGVIFVLLGAPIWGTFLDTLKQAYTGYNAVSAYQIQPSLLLGAFDEAFYRPLMPNLWAFNPSANFLLFLGVLYFLATLRTHFPHRAAITLAATALLPLALAFGLVPPAWIVRVPFLANVAHVDNTFTCALLILWSALAGVGFARALSRLGTPEGRHDLIVAGLLLLGLVFGWIGFGHASHRPIFGPTFTVNPPGQSLPIPSFLWGYLAALLIAAVTFALAARRSLRLGRMSPALGLLLAGAALAMCWRMGLHAPAVGFETYTARPPVRVNFHAKSDAIEFVRAAHLREPTRGFGLHGNYFPGWTAVYGLESVHGPDALVNPWMRDLAGASGIERLWDWRLYADASSVAAARPFLDALNVRYYFDLLSDQAALGKSLTFLKGSDLDVYESKTAWPRAFFTDRLATYEHTPELMALIKNANGRPLAAAQRPEVTASPALARLAGDLASRTVTPATAYRLTNNTTSFSVRASGPGAIMLAEVLWPRDFQVEVNGQRGRVIRLNHAFKGVLVDAAGEYRVTFRYWPRNLTRNLLLAGLGALLLAGTFLVALRPARSP
jgi:hypothetical protein